MKLADHRPAVVRISRMLFSTLLAVSAALLTAGCGDSSPVGPDETEIGRRTQPPGAIVPQAPIHSGPWIEFDTLEHDFGSVWVGQAYDYSFVFRNVGTETLTIDEIKTTCGCTAATPELSELAPGQSTLLDVSFKPTGSGDQRKIIRVITNSESAPVTRLAIKAAVKAVVTCSPMILEFGTVQLGTTQTRTLTVSPRDPEMVIDRISITGEGLETHVLEGRGAEGYRIEVVVTKEAPWGELYGAGAVYCRGRLSPGEDTSEHVGRFIARGSVFGELRADKVVYNIRTAPGQAYSEVIHLTRPSGERFSVLSAEVTESTLQDVEVDVTPIVAGASGYDVTISLTAPESLRGRKFKGWIELQTDLLEDSRVRFRFAGLVSDPGP